MSLLATVVLAEDEQFRKWMENIMTRLAATTNKLSAMMSNAETGADTKDGTEQNIENVAIRDRLSAGVLKAAKASRELMGLHQDLVKAGFTTSSKKIANAQKKVQRTVDEATATARAAGVL